MKTELKSGVGPINRPIMQQTWNDLLFASWPVRQSFLRSRLPSGLQLDQFHGTCWITVTPLEMVNVGLTAFASVFAFKPFVELNLRTYVVHNDKPGVFFFSLDTNNPFVAKVARLWYHLPYFFSTMSLEKGDPFRVSSDRLSGNPMEGTLQCEYRSKGTPFESSPGSLEEWLTERYVLHTVDAKNRVRSAAIRHPRWTLHRADATVSKNTLPHFPQDVDLLGEPLFLFSRSLNVDVWTPQFESGKKGN